MNRYYYDFHIHSCLSPCGDDDNTPNNIAGMATLCGLNIVALTDHNTCKNCPAFFAAAKKYGIIPIAGMELTTSEDIHVVCLFEELSSAMRFDEYVNKKRILVRNRAEIFGEQLILDEEDNIVGKESNLLTNATEISIEDVYNLVTSFGGVSYPAHIDRDANGIIAVLGTLPPDIDFKLFELHDEAKLTFYCENYGIEKKRFIIGSDAHILTDIRDKDAYFELDDEPYSTELVRKALFDKLRAL